MLRWRPSTDRGEHLTSRRTAWCGLVRRLSADDGSASLEFVTTGLILLLPTVYLVLSVAAIQAAALGTEGAARQAARVFVRAEDPTAAIAAAERAVAFAFSDYGLDPSTSDIVIFCTPQPEDCLVRAGSVTVTVRSVVPLPLVPPVLDVDLPLGVPIEASATQPVSRFQGAG